MRGEDIVFGPALNIPTTDEEAKQAIAHGVPKAMRQAAIGIFECDHAMGIELVPALRNAFLATLPPDLEEKFANLREKPKS